MNRIFLLLLIVIIGSPFSCKNSDSTETDNPVSDKVFTIDRKALTKDFKTWYNYTYNNIHLSQDFIGLGTDSEKISKTAFLNQLLTGNEVAFKIKILQGKPVYQLFKLNLPNESIKATIKQMAVAEIAHYKMEGIEIPDFHFTDLNGKAYTKPSTKGKIVVLKCWFIHCTACVQEFPELNKLVDNNKDRSDVLFISLALDSKQDLIKFLKTKEFKYAVIPEAEDYILHQLQINEFPTHFLIGRDGKIIKVVNRIENLIPFLKKEKAKKI